MSYIQPLFIVAATSHYRNWGPIATKNSTRVSQPLRILRRGGLGGKPIKHKSIYSYFTLHFSHFPLVSGLESEPAAPLAQEKFLQAFDKQFSEPLVIFWRYVSNLHHV